MSICILFIFILVSLSFTFSHSISFLCFFFFLLLPILLQIPPSVFVPSASFFPFLSSAFISFFLYLIIFSFSSSFCSSFSYFSITHIPASYARIFSFSLPLLSLLFLLIIFLCFSLICIFDIATIYIVIIFSRMCGIHDRHHLSELTPTSAARSTRQPRLLFKWIKMFEEFLTTLI